MAIKYWGGGSGDCSDYSFDNPLNWDNDTLPINGDSLYFDYTLTTNPCYGGVASPVQIENITVDANWGSNLCLDISSVYNGGIAVYGNLVNNSSYQAQFSGKLIGLQSFVGMWGLRSTYCGSSPLAAGNFIAQSDVTFDVQTDVIYFIDIGSINNDRLKYGEWDGSAVVNESYFNLFTIENSNPMTTPPYFGVGAYPFNIEGVEAQTLTFTDVSINVFYASTGFSFWVYNNGVININANNNFNQFFYSQSGNYGPSGQGYLVNIPYTCTINANYMGSLNSSFGGPMGGAGPHAIFKIGDGVSSQPVVFNLYGTTTLNGTDAGNTNGCFEANGGIFGVPSSCTVNAYDNSCVSGFFNEYGFTNIPTNSSFMYPQQSVAVNMYEDSIFSGIILGNISSTGNGPVKFYDNSNLNTPMGMSWPVQFFTSGSGLYGLITRTTTIPFYKSSF